MFSGLIFVSKARTVDPYKAVPGLTHRYYPGLIGMNTPAYFAPSVKNINSFITLKTNDNVMKRFTAIVYLYS